MATDKDIDELESQARSAEDKALASQTASLELPNKLRDAVSQRFNQSPIREQRDEALQTFLTSPNRARADISETIQGGTILSPTQQQSILASRQAADTVPLVSLNDLLQSQTGGMENLIRSGVDAFSALVASQQGKAGLARERANRAFEQDIAERELALKAAQQEPSPLQQMLSQLLLKRLNGEEQTRSPTQSAGPGERWTFNNQTGQWFLIPDRDYNVGDTIVDDTTGQELVFNGQQFVGAESFKETTIPDSGGGNFFTNTLSTLFGGG